MSEWGYHNKGGYFFDAKAERKSWDELDKARDDWLFSDAEHWYARLLSGKHHLSDLKVGAVKMYVGAILRHATLLSQPSDVQCSTARCSK